MTAAPTKTSRGGKGLRVDTKTRKVQKPEGETMTAAQGAVMMENERDGLTVAKSENRTSTKTLTQV